MGRVTRRTEADGSWHSFYYDSAGLLQSIGNHRGETVAVGRDTAGAQVSANLYNASGTLVRGGSRQLDALGRTKRFVDARGYGTQMLYHADARPRGVTNPVGQSFTQQLDLLDRVTSRTQPNTTAMRNAGGPATTSVTHGYDANANHVSTSDNLGVGTTYGHDAFRQRNSEASADAGTQTATRNTAGDITSVTDPTGFPKPRQLDAFGRIKTILAGTPNAVTFTYVPGRSDSLPATMTDATASTSWSYDGAGRLLSKRQTVGGVARTLTVARDSIGRPISMTYPSGMRVDIAYTADVVSSISVNGAVLLSGVSYRPFSNVATGWQWGGGGGYSRGFDTDGRITSVTLGPRNRTYTYDAAGRVASQATTGATTVAYGYDELGQLISAGAATYTWDGNGNRRSAGTSSYAYVAGTNRLASVSGLRSYTYHVDGAVRTDGTGWTYDYDYFRRMVRASKPNDTTITFLYNGLGQRVSKQVSKYSDGGTPTAVTPGPSDEAAAAGSAWTTSVAALAGTWRTTSNRHFFYDDAGRLLGEYDSVSAVGTQETIWFNGMPVAMRQGGALYRIHADHLGTPRSITRASDGVEVWRWDSDAFGNGAPITMGGGAVVTYHPRFPGQYLDNETGLHYNMARYYEPVTGRYTQADPIGLLGGVARYTYVRGSPVGSLDPSGLAGFDGAFWGQLGEVIHDGAIRIGARWGAAGFALAGGVWIGQEINDSFEGAYGQSLGGFLYDRYGPRLPDWQPRQAPIELWDVPVPMLPWPGMPPAPYSCR